MRISVAINIFYNISVTKLKRHFNVYWISAAGIPDFRSPGTGLYDNLQEYNLPSPQAIFELEFFKKIQNHSLNWPKHYGQEYSRYCFFVVTKCVVCNLLKLCYILYVYGNNLLTMRHLPCDDLLSAHTLSLLHKTIEGEGFVTQTLYSGKNTIL